MLDLVKVLALLMVTVLIRVLFCFSSPDLIRYQWSGAHLLVGNVAGNRRNID